MDSETKTPVDNGVPDVQADSASSVPAPSGGAGPTSPAKDPSMPDLQTATASASSIPQRAKVKKRISNAKHCCVIISPFALNTDEVLKSLVEEYEFSYNSVDKLLAESGVEEGDNLSADGKIIKQVKAEIKKNRNSGSLVSGFPLTEVQLKASRELNIFKYFVLDGKKGREGDMNITEKALVDGRIFEQAKSRFGSMLSSGEVGVVDVDDKDAIQVVEEFKYFLGPSKQEETAATKIQAIQRGKKAKKEIQEREASSIKIQAVIRGKHTRKIFEEKKRLRKLHNEHMFFSTIVAAAEKYEKDCKSTFKRNNSISVETAKTKWCAINSRGKPELAEFQDLLQSEAQFATFKALFERVDKSGEACLNYKEYQNLVSDHGGHLSEQRRAAAYELKNKVIVLEFLVRKDEIRQIFDTHCDDNKELDMGRFRGLFAENSRKWGYDSSDEISNLGQAAIFDRIDKEHNGKLSWEEFHDFMDELAHGDARKISQEVVARSASFEAEKRRKDRAQRAKQNAEQYVYETASEDETEGVKKKQNLEEEQEQNLEDEATPTRRVAIEPPSEDQNSPPTSPLSRKEMLIVTIRKYRHGLNRLFQFYSKANLADFKGRTFESIANDHAGVSLIMFRLMMKDLNLVLNKNLKSQIEAARRRHAVEGFLDTPMPYEELANESRPYVTQAVVEKCFRKKSTLMKGVSVVSQGKGILSKSQFVSALANVAVELLSQFPWNERYIEEWRRVDAVFARLDFLDLSKLNQRIRGRGGFGVGDGDLTGHLGSLPYGQRCSFSYPLSVPGDPKTPEPTVPKKRRQEKRSRRRSPELRMSPKEGSGGRRYVRQENASKSQKHGTRMTISLAAEFGIDDTVNDFGNPYGASVNYNAAASDMLNALNLTYGVDEDRLHMGNNEAGLGNSVTGRRMLSTDNSPLASPKQGNKANFYDQMAERNAWAMTWNELETGNDTRRIADFNDHASQRRRRMEKPPEGYQYRHGPKNATRRSVAPRVSPRTKHISHSHQQMMPPKIVPHRTYHANREQAYSFPSPERPAGLHPPRRRTPGKHISSREFADKKRGARRKRGKSSAGRSTFGGRPSPSSTESPSPNPKRSSVRRGGRRF